MRLKLDPKFIDYLMDQPESGQGYQNVKVTLIDMNDQTTDIECVVYNASEIEMPEDYATQDIVGVKMVRK